MPEGDTVWLAGQRMHGALAGRTLTVSDFRVPQLATVDLTGRQVLEVLARGKHLLTRVEGGLSIHTHFRMEGSFRLFRPGQRWRGGPPWQVRLVLGNVEWLAVGYRLPVVEVLPTAEESDVVGHLGPDVLDPDFDLDAVLTALAAQPEREIGMALLDQRILAGVGNLYRTEALFLEGISPWTSVRDVAEVGRIVTKARRLMLANQGRWEQTTTGALSRAENHHVFERGGRACRRCGTVIRIAEQGPPGQSRVTYWCPNCQPGPAPAGHTGRSAVGSGQRYRK